MSSLYLAIFLLKRTQLFYFVKHMNCRVIVLHVHIISLLSVGTSIKESSGSQPDVAPSSSATHSQTVTPSPSAEQILDYGAKDDNGSPLIPTLEKKPKTQETLPGDLPEIVSPSLQDLGVSFHTPSKFLRVGTSAGLDKPDVLKTQRLTIPLGAIDDKGKCSYFSFI